MRLKPCANDRCNTLIRCRPRILRQLIASSIRCTAGETHSSFPAPDILLLDATNILSRAAADAKRCSDIPGVSIRRCFEAWVDFLIAATPPHLLVVAVFDNPATGDNRKKQNSDDYLRRRHHRQQNTSPSNAGKLTPFIKYIKSLEGGIALISEGGYEADECIGSVCTLLLAAKINSNGTTTASPNSRNDPPSILIASGDSDMHQYITSTTLILHIAPLPTLAAPSALSIVTETSFLSKNMFPPSAYADYLALVGKKEANIGGVGIGSSLAAKLLSQFHSIEGIEQAAQQGILKGWPPTVNALLQKPSNKAAAAQLERNREIFRNITDPEIVLTSEQREKVLFEIKSRLESGAASTRNLEKRKIEEDSGPSEKIALAWRHPVYAIRWLQAGPLAKNLCSIILKNNRNLGSCKVQAATPEGLPIDLFISAGGGGGGGGGKGIGIMVCAPCDFSSSNKDEISNKSPLKGPDTAKNILNSILELLEEATKREKGGEDDESHPHPRLGIFDPCRVGKKLNRAAQHHISLLKKAGVDVVLLPWWNT